MLEIQYNEKGYRIGQMHHRAKLTDRDVELIFQMQADGISLNQISKKMGCCYATVWKVANGFVRGEAVHSIKFMSVAELLHKSK